jgi:hypothetical protein
MTTPNPPSPVVEDGTFECKDGGKRSLTGVAGDGIKLTVGGSKVVPVASAAGSAVYTGCSISDSSGPKPCNSTTVSTTGATKLTVGGKPVLLNSDTVTAVNPLNGPASAKVHPGQTKLTAT